MQRHYFLKHQLFYSFIDINVNLFEISQWWGWLIFSKLFKELNTKSDMILTGLIMIDKIHGFKLFTYKKIFINIGYKNWFY